MKKNKFSRNWPIILILAGLALVTVAVVSATPVQATSDPRDSLSQTTPPVSTLPVPTIVVTAVIPDTGGDTVFIDFFSSWVLWAVLGFLVIVLLVTLIARPRGPVDPGPHHHHDV